MCTFAVAKRADEPSTTIYAQALVMIMLRFGIAQTIVLDADKRFYNTFYQMCELLNFSVHTINGGNHDPIMVERVKNYLNKELKIFTQERGTPAVSPETVLFSIYVSNSCAVHLANISRGLVVTRCDFFFIINVSREKGVTLTGSKT
jgi:hypothetical protein